MRRDIVCATTQGKYQTVAEALQTAVTSLLEDEEMKYSRNFYYWAAFITHGFASIKLDDALLDQIHERLEVVSRQQEEEEEEEYQLDDDGQENDVESNLTAAVLTLTRNAYHRLEEREETLSREWCKKWGVQTSD